DQHGRRDHDDHHQHADEEPEGLVLGPERVQHYLTVRVPSMPASRWPGTEQKNVYLPGLTSTLMSDEAPPLTTGPFWLTPGPSRAMLWPVLDLLTDLISSAPAGDSAASTV